MFQIGSFVIHKVRMHKPTDDPAIPLYGSIVRKGVNGWIIEWLDGTVTEELEKDVTKI